MNDRILLFIRIAMSLIIPLIAVTIGGMIVYGNPSTFFCASPGATQQTGNAPAMVYYGITVVLSLMYILMKQSNKGYELILIAVISLVFGVLMQRIPHSVHRALYAFTIPILVFFGFAWLVLKYVFFNPPLRQVRLLLFTLLCACGYSVSMWLQYLLSKALIEPGFLQSRFISGVMLFVFLGLGFTMMELFMSRLEVNQLTTRPETPDDDEED